MHFHETTQERLEDKICKERKTEKFKNKKSKNK